MSTEAALPSAQRRLRHLSCIQCRHLRVLDEDFPASRFFALYYTLQTAANAPPFYTSEPFARSTNPAWRNVDQGLLRGAVDTATSRFVLRVWRTAGEEQAHGAGTPGDLRLGTDAVPILACHVDLLGLRFVRKKLTPGEPHEFGPNTLLFRLRDSWFCAPAQDTGAASVASALPILRVERSRARNTYSASSLDRIVSLLAGIALARSKKAEADSAAAELEHNQAALHAVLTSRECQRVRVSTLRLELRDRAAVLLAATSKVEHHVTALAMHKGQLAGVSSARAQGVATLGDLAAAVRSRREQLHQAVGLVRVRQRRVMVELHGIYPLVERSALACTIAGLHLPNAEFAGADEELVATAFGHVAHLVSLVGKYLDVPLRYSINAMCSRSTIRDDISASIPDKDRDFPLYSRGKERYQFEYGVFLMNKNIQQLLNCCGANVQDLRNTLPNLRLLMRPFLQSPTAAAGGVSTPRRPSALPTAPTPTLSLSPSPSLTSLVSTSVASVVSLAARAVPSAAHTNEGTSEGAGAATSPVPPARISAHGNHPARATSAVAAQKQA